MADIAMERSCANLLRVQLMALDEGLDLYFNPLEKRQRIRHHRVGDGETLPIISMRVFQTPDRWRDIARENEIDYPFVVYPGQILRLPEDV